MEVEAFFMYQKFFKYGIVGATAAVVNFVIFVLCDRVFEIHYLLSGVIAFVVATYWNFILARKMVFQSKYRSALTESMLVYLVSAVGACVDIGVLYVCVDMLGLDSIFAKIIAIGVAFIFNFGLRHFVIYRE